MSDFMRWPFEPVDNLPEAIQTRWWSECFLPTSDYVTLQNQPHWAILVGGAGCGKSILLRALKRARQVDDFVLDLPVISRAQGAAGDSNLLAEIMTLATQRLSDHFSDNQSMLEKISPTQRQFVRWLFERFLGRRPYLVFLDGLDPNFRNLIEGVAFEEFYPTQTEIGDVRGQINELGILVRSLGFQNILVFVDTVPYATEAQLKKLVDFLGWLEPMHHRGFVVMSAISQALFDQYNLEYLMRGRVKIIRVASSPQESRAIAGRRLFAATNGKLQTLEDIAEQNLLDKLEQMVIKEFDSLFSGPLVNLTELLLDSMKPEKKVAEQQFEHLQSSFYLKHLPLRLGVETQRRGVWRGHRFIPLDTGVYELLERLSKSRVDTWGGRGGDEYLHKLASRLRKAIEPNAQNPIYIQNRRNEGYWLEGLAEK